jgi:hypothetical protein
MDDQKSDVAPKSAETTGTKGELGKGYELGPDGVRELTDDETDALRAAQPTALTDPLGADAHSHATAAPETQREHAAIVGKSPSALPRFEGVQGDYAFITGTRSKPDGSTVRSLTHVQIIGVEGGRYRVNLGRGLTTLCSPEHLTKPPAEGIDGKKLFAIGDVVELPDARSSP